MTFTTEKQATKNDHLYKTTYTWEPTTNTLNPELTQTDYYIYYAPYDQTPQWYQLSTRRYTQEKLHNNEQPTTTTYIYKETADYTQEYTLETTTHDYHYHGTLIPTTLEYALKQTAITQQEHDTLLQTYNELRTNHDTTKQQQLYNTLDNL